MRRSKTTSSAPRDPSVLRVKKARKVCPAGSRSFRNWARNELGNRAREQLSPKLAQIVHGPA